MEITAAQVKALRDATGAGMMDCKKALQDADGDLDKARQVLRERGQASAQKRSGRTTEEGIIATYLHTPNPNLPAKLGVMIELNCETDFVAKTEQFQDLARSLSLHIAAANPVYPNREAVPADELQREREIYVKQAEGKPARIIDRIVDGKVEGFYRQVVLLDQEYVRDSSQTVQQLLDTVSASLGEKLAVRRFVRFLVGESE